MPSSSSTFSTPMCAMPLANPPPSANPSVRRGPVIPTGRVNSRENARTERTIRPKLPTAYSLWPAAAPRDRPCLHPTAARHHAAISSAGGVSFPTRPASTLPTHSRPKSCALATSLQPSASPRIKMGDCQLQRTLPNYLFPFPYSFPMVRETSAGGVVLRKMRGRWYLAVIEPHMERHNKHITIPKFKRTPGDAESIALPKGSIDPGERPEQTALREVREETGVRADLVAKLLDIRYIYVRNWGNHAKVSKT